MPERLTDLPVEKETNMLRKAIFALALMSGGTAVWLAGSSDPVSADAGPLVAAPMDHVLVAADRYRPRHKNSSRRAALAALAAEAMSESYVTQETQPDAAEAICGNVRSQPYGQRRACEQGEACPGDAGLLSVMLSQGKRAVAVRIGADTTAGGFILPNDQVDVLHTRVWQDLNGRTDASSRAILRKVRVLAIDQAIDPDTGSVVGKTATLELTPQEAETVVAAEADGTITLALRSFSDIDVADVPDEPAG